MSLGKVYGKDEEYTMMVCTNNERRRQRALSASFINIRF